MLILLHIQRSKAMATQVAHLLSDVLLCRLQEIAHQTINAAVTYMQFSRSAVSSL